jgi:hypothetical protein
MAEAPEQVVDHNTLGLHAVNLRGTQGTLSAMEGKKGCRWKSRVMACWVATPQPCTSSSWIKVMDHAQDLPSSRCATKSRSAQGRILD